MLPIYQTQLRELSQMQTQWASQINPVISAPITRGLQLKNVVLTTGDNVVNHGLGRALTGWFPVRWHGAWAQLYDTQDTNQFTSLTLNLNASAGATVDLWVY